MEQVATHQMLSVGEAAKRLGVKYYTALAWTRAGCPIDGATVYLRCVCVGTRTRIPPDAIEEFMAACLKARRGGTVVEVGESPEEYEKKAAEAVAAWKARYS